jgi:predicted DNA-binding transcriptional regulator YafY
LLLDDDEAVAVAVGLRTAASGGVSGVEETSARALAKLEQVLPSRLRARVTALQGVTVTMRGGGPSVDPEVLAVVAGACRAHERLRFAYRDHDGGESLRTTEPHRLVHTGRRWYLVAWDVGRRDWRTFRVDRLVPRVPAGPRFTPRPPPAEDVSAYASWAVSTGGYRYQGRFTLHAPAAVVEALVPPTSGTVEPLDDERCTLHAGSNNLDALAVHVGVLGFELEVHEPPELVERFRELAGRFARAAPA